MDYIKIRTFSSLPEAHIVKGRLENEGIPCFLTNENLTNLFPQFPGILGSGVQLFVHKSNVEAAQALLNEQSPPF